MQPSVQIPHAVQIPDARKTSRSMDTIFTLTRDNIIAEQVDADEKSLGESLTFSRGTVLTMIRPAHAWGNVKGLEYCTVQIGGKYFNILARMLRDSILLMPK